MRRLTCLVLALLAFNAAPVRPALGAWSHDPNVNNPLTDSPDNRDIIVAVSDGAGGVIAAYRDFRNGNMNSDIFISRLDRNGERPAGWSSSGNPVCVAPDYQDSPAIVADGYGGAILTWLDARNGGATADIFAQRIRSDGAPAPGWPIDGVPIRVSAEFEYDPKIAADGIGGAYIVWLHSYSPTDRDIYGAHVDSTGAVATYFISTSTADETEATIASDGNGGAFVVWRSDTNGTIEIRIARLTPGGGVLGTGGFVIGSGAGGREQAVVESDGAGGAFVAWRDSRNGPFDVFGQRVDSTVTTEYWTPGGRALCAGAQNHHRIRILAGAGNPLYVAWQDYRDVAGSDVYALRLDGSGAPAPGWPDCGVKVSDSPGSGNGLEIMADGLGGIFAAWADVRSGGVDIYASHLDGQGQLVSGWGYGGTAVCTANNPNFPSGLVADDRHGAIVYWSDARDLTSEAYVQRVDGFGVLGDPSASIASVKDVAGDEGGQVRISWTPSWLDFGSPSGILEYQIWRQVPTAVAISALTAGRRTLWTRPAPVAAASSITAEPPAAPPPGAWRAQATGAGVIYWEYVDRVPGKGFSGYSYTAATTTDSIAGANPYTTFMVDAVHQFTPAHWESAPDSGYSVDDLGPPVTQPFTAQFLAAQIVFQWGSNPAPDLAYYRLYRGATPDFDPVGGALLASTTATGWVTDDLTPGWYKLVAIDTHGNIGPAATLAPNGTVDVDATLPHMLALAMPAPNPSRGVTRLSFDLPRPAHVRLAVFDMQGRRVRVLVDGALPAGTHAASWDGANAAGAGVASGLYVIRLEAEGRTLTRRVSIMR